MHQKYLCCHQFQHTLQHESDLDFTDIGFEIKVGRQVLHSFVISNESDALAHLIDVMIFDILIIVIWSHVLLHSSHFQTGCVQILRHSRSQSFWFENHQNFEHTYSFEAQNTMIIFEILTNLWGCVSFLCHMSDHFNYTCTCCISWWLKKKMQKIKKNGNSIISIIFHM